VVFSFEVPLKAKKVHRGAAVAMIENVIPILRVQDLEASRRYYIQKLGFHWTGMQAE
jgi:hypothetical protein